MKKIIGLVMIIALFIGIFQLLKTLGQPTSSHIINVIYSPFNKICRELDIQPLPVKKAGEHDLEVGFVVKSNNETRDLVIRDQNQIKLVAAWIKKDCKQKLTALFTELELLFQLLENSKNYVSKKEQGLASDQIKLVSEEAAIQYYSNWLETHNSSDKLTLGDCEYDYETIRSDVNIRRADCESLGNGIKFEQQIIAEESKQIVSTEERLQAIKQYLEVLSHCLQITSDPSALQRLWYVINKIHFKKVTQNSSRKLI